MRTSRTLFGDKEGGNAANASGVATTHQMFPQTVITSGGKQRGSMQLDENYWSQHNGTGLQASSATKKN